MNVISLFDGMSVGQLALQDLDIKVDGDIIRKFDSIEAERLQTLPTNYTGGVSNTQRYKMIGNGWTLEVIKHILGNMV